MRLALLLYKRKLMKKMCPWIKSFARDHPASTWWADLGFLLRPISDSLCIYLLCILPFKCNGEVKG